MEAWRDDNRHLRSVAGQDDRGRIGPIIHQIHLMLMSHAYRGKRTGGSPRSRTEISGSSIPRLHQASWRAIWGHWRAPASLTTIRLSGVGRIQLRFRLSGILSMEKLRPVVRCLSLVRGGGVEPPFTGSEPGVLPIGRTPNIFSATETNLYYRRAGGIRTLDRLLKRQML
jgi:hypothetical protein